VLEREPWWPRRDQAYLGVLVDDLITRGTREPYRMFTSRAEYRLMLREDNADLRLTGIGRDLGLVDDARWARFAARREAIERETVRLAATRLRPETVDDDAARRVLGQALTRDQSLMDLLRRPEAEYGELMRLAGLSPVDDASVAEQVAIQAKYAGYLQRQHDEIERHRRSEDTLLPDAFDYSAVRGLSSEVRQRLSEHRPATLGQASRISGVTPAAISLLLVHLRKKSA
jgi:tRNA uridine 5-carboxymethylaminomethyl modification enzyme